MKLLVNLHSTRRIPGIVNVEFTIEVNFRDAEAKMYGGIINRKIKYYTLESLTQHPLEYFEGEICDMNRRLVALYRYGIVILASMDAEYNPISDKCILLKDWCEKLGSESAGEASEGSNCPLHNWWQIESRLSADNLFVDTKRMWLLDEMGVPRTYDLPSWAVSFVSIVDGAGVNKVDGATCARIIDYYEIC